MYTHICHSIYHLKDMFRGLGKMCTKMLIVTILYTLILGHFYFFIFSNTGILFSTVSSESCHLSSLAGLGRHYHWSYGVGSYSPRALPHDFPHLLWLPHMNVHSSMASIRALICLVWCPWNSSSSDAPKAAVLQDRETAGLCLKSFSWCYWLAILSAVSINNQRDTAVWCLRSSITTTSFLYILPLKIYLWQEDDSSPWYAIWPFLCLCMALATTTREKSRSHSWQLSPSSLIANPSRLVFVLQLSQTNYLFQYPLTVP